MCLLKNDEQLLPLKKDLPRIAVIGPNANIARLGDYSEGGADRKAPRVECSNSRSNKLVSPQTKLSFCDGDDVKQATKLAQEADVVILGLGEWQKISGEGFDRASLNLPGQQEALRSKPSSVLGKPVVLVLQNGCPLSITWAAEHVPAILEAWYPGESGGRAIAETLFGDNNPAGRLSITFPRSVGDLPDYYNHFPSRNGSYVDGDSSPLFPFGYGLSYTTFKYDQLSVDTSAASSGGGDVSVTARITNTGRVAGDEVAQLYVHQETASVATPIKVR